MEIVLRLTTADKIRRFTAGVNAADRAQCRSCANLVTVGLGAWSKNCKSPEWYVTDEMITEEPYTPYGDSKCLGYIRAGN